MVATPSLAELDKDLCEISKNKLSQSINFFDGNAEKIIISLCKTYKIKNVFFNRRYELENIITEKIYISNSKIMV